MNERIRIDVGAAMAAGRKDGLDLVTELCNMAGKNTAESLFMQSLSEIIGLAIECRSAEAHARLSGYADVVASMLADAANKLPALEAKCTLLSASLSNADEYMERVASLPSIGRLDHLHADSEGVR